MEVIKGLRKQHNLSLALGYFDGVHLGHQAVIKNAVQQAKLNNSQSAVITFSDHPYCFLRGVCPKYILTRKEREKHIEALGVDYLFELDFESISGLTAQDYLRDILIKYFTPNSISTGWNHNFGYNKAGNVKYLTQESQKYGYKYFELSPEKYNNEIISSTAIRNLLIKGEIEKANKMLGYKYCINGTVIKGNQIGRTIGFNTANLKYPEELITIPFGVYSVDTNYGKGIANFGIRPTIGGNNTLLEVHIINFNEDIYNKNLNVQFNKMIRTEKKFPSLDALKNQISKDIESI